MTNLGIVAGRVVRIEVKKTEQDPKTGKDRPVFAIMTIANEKTFKNAEGNKEVRYIKCALNGANAERGDKYLSPGRYVIVKGTMEPGQYTDSNGVKHETFQLRVDPDGLDFSGAGGKSSNGGDTNGTPANSNTSDVPMTPEDEFAAMAENDIPF